MLLSNKLLAAIGRRWISIAILFILLVGFTNIYAQLTETDAKQKFSEYGCTNCHVEGGAAAPWNEIISEIKAWASEYGSLDEGARHVVYFGQSGKFTSFDDLISQMASNVGKSPSEISDLTQFFKSIFDEAKQAAGGGAAKPPTSGPQAGGGIPSELLIAVVLAVIIIVVIALYVLRR